MADDEVRHRDSLNLGVCLRSVAHSHAASLAVTGTSQPPARAQSRGPARPILPGHAPTASARSVAVLFSDAGHQGRGVILAFRGVARRSPPSMRAYVPCGWSSKISVSDRPQVITQQVAQQPGVSVGIDSPFGQDGCDLGPQDGSVGVRRRHGPDFERGRGEPRSQGAESAGRLCRAARLLRRGDEAGRSSPVALPTVDAGTLQACLAWMAWSWRAPHPPHRGKVR